MKKLNVKEERALLSTLYSLVNEVEFTNKTAKLGREMILAARKQVVEEMHWQEDRTTENTRRAYGMDKAPEDGGKTVIPDKPVKLGTNGGKTTLVGKPLRELTKEDCRRLFGMDRLPKSYQE